MVKYYNNGSGRGSVWLERDVRDAEVAGLNPVAPTTLCLYFQVFKRLENLKINYAGIIIVSKI